ncbi:MAG: Gfo/Idh/MocA family oxidoreductase [Marinilabiliales bacterium]|nr:Gfo/Idh/MocA family oxidoreductase [Marinilabiliales bacterium]
MKKWVRREFISRTSAVGVGLGLISPDLVLGSNTNPTEEKRIGMIGLDTSHCVAFATALNGENGSEKYMGYRIVIAYPYGSRDIQSSAERIPGYTEAVKKLGVTIASSVEEVLKNCDVVMLETNDGRLHPEQAMQVIKAGKRMFIDKPVTASLASAMAVYRMAKKFGVKIFSSSSLRFVAGMQEISRGEIGKVIGAQTYSPAKLEKSHPDLFWYGIHGVEMLYAAMDRGCMEVTRISNDDTDLVTGLWPENRLGTFRGMRSGKTDYGGTVFGEKAIRFLGPYDGYNALLEQIIAFFESGVPPVDEEETLEILAFMEAADLSKAAKGQPVSIASVMKAATEDKEWNNLEKF